MSKPRVVCFGLSIDGFGAGPDQSVDNPFGVGGLGLHQWVFPTRTFQKIHGSGNGDGTTGVDNDLAERGFCRIGAWILGRNMVRAGAQSLWAANWANLAGMAAILSRMLSFNSSFCEQRSPVPSDSMHDEINLPNPPSPTLFPPTEMVRTSIRPAASAKARSTWSVTLEPFGRARAQVSR